MDAFARPLQAGSQSSCPYSECCQSWKKHSLIHLPRFPKNGARENISLQSASRVGRVLSPLILSSSPRSLNIAQGLAPKNVDTESSLLVGFFRFETSPLDRAWTKSLGHQMTPASHPRVSAAVEKHSAQLPSGCLLLQCLRGSGETPPAYLGEFSELKVTTPV